MSFLEIKGEVELCNSIQFNQQINAIDNDSFSFVKSVYKEFGTDCIHHLSGSFSFIIEDHEQEMILGYRDSMGFFPFFYSFEDGEFFFSTDFKEVCSKIKKRTIDNQWVVFYLMDKCLDRTSTVYKEIKRLEAGHFLCVKNGELTIEKYWDNKLIPINKNIQTISQATNLLENSIQNSIVNSIQNHQSIAVELSGGIDSALITAILSKQTDHVKSLDIYTNILPDNLMNEQRGYYDEWEKAETVTKFCGINNHFPIATTFSTSTLDIIDESLKTLGRPSIFQFSFLQTGVYISAKTRGNTILFSGFGGDELVSESTTYGYQNTLWKEGKYWKLYKQFKQSNSLFSGLYRINKYVIKRVVQTEKRVKHQIFTDMWKRIVLSDKWINRYNLKIKYAEICSYPICQTLKERQFFHLKKTGLTERIETGYAFTKQLNIRYVYPLLDQKVITSYLSIPERLVAGHKTNRFLFRQICKNYLPDEITNQAKQSNAYTVPFWKHHIVDNMQLLKTYCLDINSDHTVFNYIDKQKLNVFIDSINADDSAKDFKFLMSIVMLARFYDQYDL